MTLLFEKVDGLLVQVAPDEAEEKRKGRRWSRVVACEMDVLWTAEEEAVRDAEDEAAAKAEEDRATAEAERQGKRTAALAKLERLGLSAEDLEALR